MARQLLPKGSVAGTIGLWVRIEGGGKRAIPGRVSATGAIGAWAVGPVHIEELVGGLPAFGANSPYGPNVDTGEVLLIGDIAAPGGQLTIDQPIEFIRARVDATVTGSVDYCGIEMLE